MFLKKIIEKVKGIFETSNKKRLYENLAIFGVLGILMVIAGGTFFQDNSKQEEPTSQIQHTVETSKTFTEDQSKNDLEVELRDILIKIKGAGKVDVMITMESKSEIITAIDRKTETSTTNEKDKEGGTRNITQNNEESNVSYEESGNGIKKPVIIKELVPKVKGVLVVSSGAGDANVKEKIVESVKALFEVPAFRIHVTEGN